MSISAVHRVSSRSQRNTLLTSVRSVTCLLTVNNVRCDSKDRHCGNAVTVCVMLSYAVHELTNNSNSHLVNAVIIVSVFREVALNLVVNDNILGNINNIASLILDLDVLADRLNLSVLDS